MFYLFIFFYFFFYLFIFFFNFSNWDLVTIVEAIRLYMPGDHSSN